MEVHWNLQLFAVHQEKCEVKSLALYFGRFWAFTLGVQHLCNLSLNIDLHHLIKGKAEVPVYTKFSF